MKRFVVAGLTLPFFLVGCGGSGASTSDAPAVPIDRQYRVPLSGTSDTLVVEFNLQDGTRCVVSDGVKSGGIDCDW